MKINILLPVDERTEKTNLETVGAVMSALVKAPALADSMGRARQSLGVDKDALASQLYVSSHDVEKLPPPAGAPFLIASLGVLSIEAPGVESVRDALQSIAGVKVEVDAPCHGADLAAATTAPLLPQHIPWGIKKVEAPAAWSMGYQGQGVRVAVVDTAVDDRHDDLPQSVASVSFVVGEPAGVGADNHGTGVAGTIFAQNNDRCVVGVAPQATMIVAKVLPSTARGGCTSRTAAGIEWAVHQKSDVINLSLVTCETEVLNRALQYAHDNGVALCAAVGNGYDHAVRWPAASPCCIAVAACTLDGYSCNFNNSGPEVDIVAPGLNIFTTAPGNERVLSLGTTMATAHVTGVAALLLSQGKVEPVVLKKRLQNGTTPLAAPVQGIASHIGIVNVANALQENIDFKVKKVYNGAAARQSGHFAGKETNMSYDVKDPAQRSQLLQEVYRRKLEAIVRSPLFSEAPDAAHEMIKILNDTHSLMLQKVRLMDDHPEMLPEPLPLPSCNCDGDGNGDGGVDIAACNTQYANCIKAGTNPAWCENQFYLCILNC